MNRGPLILTLKENNEYEINCNQEGRSINFQRFNLDINSIDLQLTVMDKMMMIVLIKFKIIEELNLEQEFQQLSEKLILNLDRSKQNNVDLSPLILNSKDLEDLEPIFHLMEENKDLLE